MFCNYNNVNSTNTNYNEKFSCDIFVILIPFFIFLLLWSFIRYLNSRRRIIYYDLNNFENTNNNINDDINNNQNINDNNINNNINNLNNNISELPPSYDSINQ